MPNVLLARYFQDRGVLGDLDFATLKETQPDELFTAWLELPDGDRNTMDAEFASIFEMSCEKGFHAIRDEAEWQLREEPQVQAKFVETLAALDNHYERAIVTFLDHPKFWKGATLFYHADTLPYWRKRKNLPHQPIALDMASRRELAGLISKYFHHTEGRGKNCLVELFRRGITSAQNPESGTILYAYDADGNVVTKTAPLPNQTGSSTVTTTNAYDKLNRLTSKSYKDGGVSDPYTPTVQYGYDAVALTTCATNPPNLTDSYPVGRRTAMCDGSGATSWMHDTMGRMLEEKRTLGAVLGDYETDAYNLDGSAQSVTSLGFRIAYTYSGAGRALTATNNAPSPVTKYVASATYAPPGELVGATLGSVSGGFAGFTVSNAYNDRLQPILLSATTPSATVFSECFDFHLGIAVNTSPCSFSAHTTGDNGNVYQFVNNRSSIRSESFNYDSLNRISNAQQTTGTQWGESYTIDAWGNMTAIGSYNSKPHESLSTTALPSNQLSGYGYDAAGNMTSNGTASYTYDAENRLIATAGYSYIYDADGQRVEKCTEGSTPGACASSGATGTLYWRGLGSDPLTETSLTGALQNNYVFFNGQRVARSDSTPLIHYYFSDHLGSHGVVENATGTTCEQDIDYYPYGGVEEDYCSGSGVAQNYKFTGKERDSESGLDNFGARYSASSLGRYMTPDWAAKPVTVPYAKFGDPQTLNLYSYVENGPVNRIDPDGHDDEAPAGGGGDPSGGSSAGQAQTKQPPPAQNTTLEKAEGAVDWFNGTLGFGKSNCAGGGSCVDALGMAGTAILTAVVSDGASEEGFAEKQIATASTKIGNIETKILTSETLQAAEREVNGGMKVLKESGKAFDHVGKVEQAISGLNKQASHLERVLQRSGLSESHVQTINGLIERARGLADVALRAITPKDPI
jgi:RHS repeat-associated protein